MRHVAWPLPRRTVAFAAVAILLLGGCDDELGEVTGPSPGPLNGDILFGSALVSSEVLRAFNAIAEVALNALESGSTLPITIGGCQGTGTAHNTDNNDSDLTTFGVLFRNFTIECDDFLLTLNSDDTVGAKMVLTFLETTPGLTFLLELPFVDFEPRGVTVQLPSEEGGIILAATTPVGPILYDLDGDRTTGGTVNVQGTLRYEDRIAPILIVKVLDIEYEFDDGLEPKFSDWFAGSYEIAAFGGGGGFGFGAATAGSPIDVFFDGFGGAAFPVGTHNCVTNLATGDNPCEDLPQ